MSLPTGLPKAPNTRPDYERIEEPNTRGKALGGSTSLNYFSWIPGCKPTFDNWTEYGGKDWSWDALVPYLRKPATFHDDNGNFPYLKKIGVDGHIPISPSELIAEMASFRERLVKAWTSRGLPHTDNIFDGEMNGLTQSVNTIYKGQRSGSYLALKGKKNITVLPEVHSKRLISDYADRTCKGVTVIDSSGQELSFYADREVILSEGVFESPKLLMLSGIGLARELSKFGIDVIVDSRHVGKHLLDYPGVPFVLRVKDGFGMDSTLMRKGKKHDAAVSAFQTSHAGPVGSGLLEMIGFPRIDKYLEKDEQYVKAKAANGGNDPFSPGG